jgi:hypothetical protein
MMEVNFRYVLGLSLTRGHRGEGNKLAGIVGIGEMSQGVYERCHDLVTSINDEILFGETIPANIETAKKWGADNGYARSDGRQNVLAVAMDGSWMRGSARKDSDTGHALIVHPPTNKLLAFATACKRCKTCEHSIRTGIEKEHKCTLNYVGSSGAMEGCLVQKALMWMLTKYDVSFDLAVMDGDASTYAAVCVPAITKLNGVTPARGLDPNHALKNIGKAFNKFNWQQQKTAHSLRLGKSIVAYIRRIFERRWTGTNYSELVTLCSKTTLHYAHIHDPDVCASCPYTKNKSYIPPAFGKWPLQNIKSKEIEITDMQNFMLSHVKEDTMTAILHSIAHKLHSQGCEWRNGHIFDTTLSKKHHAGKIQLVLTHSSLFMKLSHQVL